MATLRILLASLAFVGLVAGQQSTTEVTTNTETTLATTEIQPTDPISTDVPIIEMPSTLCEAYNLASASVIEPNTCLIGTDCKSLDCALDVTQFEFPDYAFSLSLLPCTTPPAFKVRVIFLGDSIFDGVISKSVEIAPELLFGTNITFRFEELDGAVGLEISSKVPPFDESGDAQHAVLLPYVAYPVDASSCPLDTCEVITSLASGEKDCIISPNCNGILCRIAPLQDSPDLVFDLTAKIVPCNSPPAVQLIISDAINGGRPLANEVLTNTSVVMVLGNPLYVTVDQFDGAVGAQVETEQTSDYGDIERVPVLEYSYFPIVRDEEECDVYSPTCLGFQTIVDQSSRNNITCETTSDCKGVRCFLDLLGNGALFESTTSLACHESQPGFDLVLREPAEDGQQGNVFINRRIFRPETRVGILVYDIIFQLTRLPESNSLGVEIMLRNTTSYGEEGDQDFEVVRYTEIPVDEVEVCGDFIGGAPTLSVSVFVMTVTVLLSMLWS